MKTYKELKELQAAEFAAIEQILETCRTEGRVDANGEPMPTPEECKRIEEHTANAAGIQDECNAIDYRQKVLEEKERVKASAVRDTRGPDPVPTAITEHTHDLRLDDPKGQFKNYGEFMRCVRGAAIGGSYGVDPRLTIQAATGMSELSGPDGAFAVPPQFRNTIWESIFSDDPVNLVARCDQIPVAGKDVTLPADAESSRAVGSQAGGLRAYWLNEGGTLTGSKPTLRTLTLKPKKLTALVYMTDELMQDSMAMQAYLERRTSKVLNYQINKAIYRGSGVGDPLGVLNAACLTTVSAETGQTSATPLMKENIAKMFARMIPASKMGAVWLVNPGLMPYLQATYAQAGVGGIPAYMPPGGLSQTPYGTLMGLPLLECEWCSAYNTTGDILLGNFSKYVVATKGGVRADTSIHVQFTTDETAFRFIIRIDGQPWRTTTLTGEYAASGETYSDFVALETRS